MAFGKDTGRVRGLYHGLVVSDSTDTVYDEYNEWMNVFKADKIFVALGMFIEY